MGLHFLVPNLTPLLQLLGPFCLSSLPTCSPCPTILSFFFFFTFFYPHPPQPSITSATPSAPSASFPGSALPF